MGSRLLDGFISGGLGHSGSGGGGLKGLQCLKSAGISWRNFNSFCSCCNTRCSAFKSSDYRGSRFYGRCMSLDCYWHGGSRLGCGFLGLGLGKCWSFDGLRFFSHCFLRSGHGLARFLYFLSGGEHCFFSSSDLCLAVFNIFFRQNQCNVSRLQPICDAYVTF